MIYAKHNFAENFMNANGTTFSLDRDMIISELARVINANPVGVKDAIFDCGINIDPQADKFEISSVMSGNMANNDHRKMKGIPMPKERFGRTSGKEQKM